jgi:hypothetical protein
MRHIVHTTFAALVATCMILGSAAGYLWHQKKIRDTQLELLLQRQLVKEAVTMIGTVSPVARYEPGEGTVVVRVFGGDHYFPNLCPAQKGL